MKQAALIIIVGLAVGLALVYNFTTNVEPQTASEVQRLYGYYGPVFLLLVACTAVSTYALLGQKRSVAAG